MGDRAGAWGWAQRATLGAAVILSVAAGASAANVSIIGPFGSWGPELQEAFDGFSARTGISVEVVPAASWPELLDKVVTMSAAGVPPDVVYADNLRTMELAEEGLLRPVGAMAAGEGIDLRVYPSLVLDGLRVRGELYALPTAVSIHSTFFNVDLFQQAGLEPLPTDWRAPGFDWNEFVSLARKLTVDADGNGQPERFGVQSFGYEGGFNMIGLWGAQDVDRDRTRYRGESPDVIRALTFTTGLWLEHNVVGGNFLNGTAAMQPVQPYYLNNVLQAARSGNLFSWSLGILPKGDVRVSQASFHSLAVTRGARHQREAWQFVRFLSHDPEGVLLFTRAENRVPVVRSASADFVRRWREIAPGSNPQVYTEAVSVLWDWRIISGRGASEILRAMTAAWNQIRTRQSSVQEAVATIAPRMQAALNRD